MVCSLGNTDIFIIDYFLENLLNFYKLKKIDKEDLKNLLNFYLNYYLINKNLGRNISFKPGDETSVFNTSKSRINYFMKNVLSSPSKEKLIKKIKIDNEIILQLHNALHYIDLILFAFSDIKIINIVSHPIDQIFSIYNKQKTFGDGNYARDLLAGDLKYSYKRSNFSIHAFGLEKKFNKLNRLRKILYSKNEFDNLDLKKIKLIKRQKRNSFLLINYEDIFFKKNEILKKICKFLKRTSTAKTQQILKSNEFSLRKKEIFKRPFRKEFLFRKFNKNDLKIFRKTIETYEAVRK